MRYIIYLWCIMIIHFETSAYKHRRCDDCVKLQECSDIKYEQKNVPKIRAASCGYDGGPKVCCSALLMDELERHPNMKLLPEKCGSINGLRIVGGMEADLYEFPWMALISHSISKTERSFNCAGSIINNRYILTAAHCLVDLNILGVRVGEYDLRYEEDCDKPLKGKPVCEKHYQDIPVIEEIYHENYIGYPNYENDIGLLRLSYSIDISRKYVAPICLPTTMKLRHAELANRMATIAGWGLTEKGESSVLLKVDVPIQGEEDCLSFHSRILETSEPGSGLKQFCAGAHHKDSCKGDSGGPVIIIDDVVNKYIQYGIVSQGNAICGSTIPSIYTSVSKYMHWILDKIKP